MEELLKQVLENQLALNDQFMKIESNQLEMLKEIKDIKIRVEKLEEKFGKIEERFGKIEERFGKIEERFEKLEGRFEKLEGRFENLEEKVENLEVSNETLNEKYERLDIKLTNFINETRSNFSSLREELSANLDDISYIFKEYDSRFSKMK